MPDMNDYNAFHSTNGNQGYTSGGGGCSGGCSVWVVLAIAIFYLVSEFWH